MLIKLAWRNIWRNKTRSIITITAVFIAVLLSDVMQSFQQGMWEKMLENTMNVVGHIQIQSKEFKDEPILDNGIMANDSLINAVTATPHVNDVTKRIQYGGLSAGDSLSRVTQVIALDPEKEEPILDIQSKLDTGSVLKSDDDGVIVGKRLADYYNFKVGDTITLIGQGYYGQSANGVFPIRGMINYGTADINSRLIFMPYTTAEKHFGADGIVTSLNVYIDDHDYLNEVADDLRSKLDTTVYRVQTWKEMMPELDQAFQADTAGNIIFLAVLYLIIAFGIFGTILMMTAERMYEFGVMISVGTRRARIAIMVLLESTLLTGLGVVIGSGIAYPIMYYLHTHEIPLGGGEDMEKMMAEFGMEPVITGSINPTILYMSALAVLLITLLIVFYPVTKVLRLNPLKAMKK